MLTPIGAILEKEIKKLGIHKRIKQELALRIWPEEVGENLSSVTRPERVREGILFVSTKSPAWAQELTLLRRNLILKLNARIGRGVIKDIRFHVTGKWEHVQDRNT